MTASSVQHQFTKADKRILIDKLKKLHDNQTFYWQFFHNHTQGQRKTNVAIKDRDFRLKIKSIEVLLYSLDPKLFTDGTRPSFRKTLTIGIGNDRLIQD